MSCFSYEIFCPSTFSTAILCAGNFAANARLPSGVNTTEATPSPVVTVSTSFTCLPWIDSTLIELSARLAIKARSPARLIERPDGCLPTATVSISAGGLLVRSIT